MFGLEATGMQDFLMVTFPSNVPLMYSPSWGITREPLIKGIGLETPLGISEYHHTAFLSHPIPVEPL